MTAFQMFQTATVLIARAERADAAVVLTKAIAQIDCDGIDRDMRADLVGLRDRLAVEVAA